MRKQTSLVWERQNKAFSGGNKGGVLSAEISRFAKVFSSKTGDFWVQSKGESLLDFEGYRKFAPRERHHPICKNCPFPAASVPVV